MTVLSTVTPAQCWYIYLLRCRDNSLYTGISLDPQRRCQEHDHHAARASRYVWSRRPATLVWQRNVASHSLALKLEYHLKRLSKTAKEALLINEVHWQQLQAQLETAP